MEQNINNRNEWYRLLPKMDELLAQDWANALIDIYGRTPVMTALRTGLEQIREEIPGLYTKEELMDAFLKAEETRKENVIIERCEE